jgi:uncharacterized tellurite resistance protein B-like protein
VARRKTSATGWLAVLLLGGAALAIDFLVRNPGVLVLPVIAIAIWIAVKLSSGIKPSAEELSQPTDSQPSYRSDSRETTIRVTRASRAPKHRNGDDFWVPLSKAVSVSGHNIGGLLYHGRELASVGGHEIEPALIDPKLSVSGHIRDCTVRRTDYWPSYSEASSEARAAYLYWLETGRRDPAADIGYVFLYFYGLERRALHDAITSDAAKADISHIDQEVSRLLDIYPANRSFQRYATSFVDFIHTQRCPESSYRHLPTPNNTRDLRFSDRLALAQCAVDGHPLPADWAHLWITNNQSVGLPMPARRCPTEFEQLFKTRYTERFGAGISLPRNRTRLKLEYRPASPSFRGNSYGLSLSLDAPDVSVLTSPLRKLEKVAVEVCDELSRYSRAVGKDPEGAESFEALAELPLALWPEQIRAPVESTHEVIRRAGKPAAVPFEKFRSWLPGSSALTRLKYRSLAASLASAGLGVEPDVRFGGKVPEPESKVVLFSDDPATAASEATAAYSAAALTLHLSTAVMMADGEVSAAEKGLLLDQFRTWLHLSESESRRLHAHLRLLLANPPKLTGLKKRIDALRPEARELLADFLIALAQADDKVTPDEVKALQKTHKLLGLDPGTVFSKLHAAATEPVKVAKPSDGAAVYRIPRPPKQTRKTDQGLRLDPAKVARLQEDSARVARILADVFEQPSDGEDPSPEDTVAGDDVDEARPTLLGLDAVHSALLETLMTRKSWGREELEELASDRELMLDGALEHINEASFDAFDMPMVEEGDPLILNEEAIREVRRDHHPES